MTTHPDSVSKRSFLYEAELEAEAEGREWARKRLQARLQKEANSASGRISPPERGENQERPISPDASEELSGRD